MVTCGDIMGFTCFGRVLFCEEYFPNRFVKVLLVFPGVFSRYFALVLEFAVSYRSFCSCIGYHCGVTDSSWTHKQALLRASWIRSEEGESPQSYQTNLKSSSAYLSIFYISKLLTWELLIIIITCLFHTHIRYTWYTNNTNVT